MGMIETPRRTKWKFVVEFEDDETREISGTIGQASDREQCEGLIEHEIQYHDSHGRTVLNAEASEVCSECDGEGMITGQSRRPVVCQSCGGRVGPLSIAKLVQEDGRQFLLIRLGDFTRTHGSQRAA
jgi:hypothetical protein